MKKKIAAFLCLSMVAVGVMGCQKEARREAEPAATPTATATAAAPQETEAVETAQARKITDAPIHIDTSISIEKGAHIAVVAKTTEGDYWKSFKKQMEEAVQYINQEYGFTGKDKITMTFEAPGDGEDVTAQINIIDAVLAENPSVLCLAAIDVNSCEAQLETAQENGIPVIMYDSSVKSDLVSTYCGTDNRKAGRMAAERLSDAVEGKGKVAVVAHERVTQTSKERVRGFHNRILKKHPQVKVTDVVYPREEESLEEAVRNLLESRKKLKGIFCTNDDAAKVVLDVLKDYPDREIQLVGFDLGSHQKKAISQGIEYGTIVQDTYRMAYETIWAAARSTALEEEQEMEDTIYIKHRWVDQSNLEMLDI